MKYFLLPFLIPFISFSQNPCESENIDGFTYLNSFEGNNYYLSNEKEIWVNANIICESIYQGHLATIASEEEQDFIYNNVIINTLANYWIGLSDVENEGSFEWVTGEEVFYQNWNTSEPNGGFNENYVEVYSENSQWPGMWNDTPISVERYYVLELECGDLDCNSSNLNIIENDTTICKGDTLELNITNPKKYFISRTLKK